MTGTIDPIAAAPHGDADDTEQAARSRSGRRWIVGAIIVVVIVAIAAAVLLRRDKGTATGETGQRAPALTVTVAAPQRADWPTVTTASGAIAPWQEASIGTQIGSYQLVEVLVNVGAHVRKGQVLARLNPALLRAEEAQLLANYEQAEANRTRALGLKGSGAMSDQEVLQYVTQAKTAAASLAAKRLQLRYTNVTAPDDGAISARTATLGAVVPAGQELFRLIRQNRLEWRGELTAAQLDQVSVGKDITLDLPDGGNATARVRQIAPALDNGTRLAIAYADVRPGSRARAGMYASGQIVLGHSSALVVPAASVIVRDGKSHVLKIAGAGDTPKVTLQPVTVGRRNGGQAEIVRGLRDGERVVVEGAGFLNDGDVVRIGKAAPRAGAVRP